MRRSIFAAIALFSIATAAAAFPPQPIQAPSPVLHVQMKQDTMKKDTMANDDMKKDSMKKDEMKKDEIKKDTMMKDEMKK